MRHYAQTKMPELAETLKPLKDLPKAPAAARTGRPRKYPVKVETVDRVPEVEPDPEPVQCIAHVTPAELAEAEEPEKPKVDPKAAMEGLSKALSDFGNNVFTKDRVLRILDEAALKCQADKCYRWGSDTLEQQMFHDARTNAVGIGVMKLRGEIRKMLGADEDEDE